MSTTTPKPPQRMKPVIVLPKGCMTKEDIRTLRENGFCCVEAEKPDLVRFIEPPPMGYSVQEQAAVKLCRFLRLSSHSSPWSYSTVMTKLAEIMIEGSPLAVVPTVLTVPPVQQAK